MVYGGILGTIQCAPSSPPPRAFPAQAAYIRCAMPVALGVAILRVAQRVRLLDPRSVLARGYAYLKKPDGRILMDVAASKPGEELTAVLRDGELDLRVAATHSLQPPAESP